jgi:hypothetical protein
VSYRTNAIRNHIGKRSDQTTKYPKSGPVIAEGRKEKSDAVIPD